MTRTLVLLAALSVSTLAQIPAPKVPAPVVKPAGPGKPAAADPDASAPAASPAQNRTPKEFPPRGVAISEADRAELTAGAAELGREIAALKLAKLGGQLEELVPDVEIFYKAVDWALRYHEFYNVKEVATARALLKEGRSRAAALQEGKAPWTTQTGPVARGFRSKIDGSVQPYGVVVPATWKGAEDKAARALWIWNHGRGETLTELAFVAQRMKSAGDFSPADTFVVHPYGRYCNATKFAGETDVFEALAAAQRAYPVDEKRLVNAGFSMGGASAWHLGAHHPSTWAVSHAGAGFAETAEYAGVFAPGKTPPPWWEQILWRWYDATVVAANYANHPMLAYHGSEDKQGQSTVIMKRFAEKEGVTIQEFIGPGVAHKYEPKTKQTIREKIADVLGKAGDNCMPAKPHLTTYSLIYPQLGTIRLTALERAWERADVDAEWSDDRLSLALKTKNVAGLRVQMAAPSGATETTSKWKIKADGQALEVAASTHGEVVLRKAAQKWTASVEPKTGAEGTAPQGFAKSATICGPIDHAFMSAFVFVRPTGEPFTPALGEWTQRELAHATKQWRGIFRGDAQTVDDTGLTDEFIKSSNLVLWGDPSSNAVIKKMVDQLPVKWTKEGVEFGGKKYGATHVPMLIFPNPLNPQKYVVLNSGFTFSRAAASGTNSQQTPKLPDWAIVDASVPPDDKYPGKVVDAGFFDEQWKFTTERPK